MSYDLVREERGQVTRANSVGADFRFIIGDRSYALTTIAPDVLGAGQTYVLIFTRFVNIFDQPTFDKILRGELLLKVYGIISYTDIFGDGYTTQCLGEFESKTNTFKIERNQAG